MYLGRTVFAQVMDALPLRRFHTCVKRYDGNHKVKAFTCLDQFRVMAFAQLTYRESLRDIEACLRAMQPKLYHMGIRSAVSRNTLANANQVRDWRIYADFAHANNRRVISGTPRGSRRVVQASFLELLRIRALLLPPVFAFKLLKHRKLPANCSQIRRIDGQPLGLPPVKRLVHVAFKVLTPEWIHVNFPRIGPARAAWRLHSSSSPYQA